MTGRSLQRALRHDPGAARRPEGRRRRSSAAGSTTASSPASPAASAATTSTTATTTSTRCAWRCRSTSAPRRPRRRSATTSCPPASSCPIGLDDPIARMTAIRELVAQQRAEPALALTEPLAGILNRLPDHGGHRHLRLDAQGRRLHHQQRARRARSRCTSAGARMESQIALGPMSGVGGQRRAGELPRRPQHRHQHRPGRRSPTPTCWSSASATASTRC